MTLITLKASCQHCGIDLSVQVHDWYYQSRNKAPSIACDACCSKIQTKRRVRELAISRFDFVEKLKSDSAIPANMRSWDSNLGNAGIMRWADQQLYQPGAWLWIGGRQRLGKSRVLAAKGWEQVLAGKQVGWYNLPGWIDQLINNKQVNPAEAQKAVNEAKRADLIILDDLDKLNATVARLSVILDLVEARYNANRPIWISSNSGADYLARVWGGVPCGYAASILARLAERCRLWGENSLAV